MKTIWECMIGTTGMESHTVEVMKTDDAYVIMVVSAQFGKRPKRCIVNSFRLNGDNEVVYLSETAKQMRNLPGFSSVEEEARRFIEADVVMSS